MVDVFEIKHVISLASGAFSFASHRTLWYGKDIHRNKANRGRKIGILKYKCGMKMLVLFQMPCLSFKPP